VFEEIGSDIWITATIFENVALAKVTVTVTMSARADATVFRSLAQMYVVSIPLAIYIISEIAVPVPPGKAIAIMTVNVRAV
jgi:hypothetical protein